MARIKHGAGGIPHGPSRRQPAESGVRGQSRINKRVWLTFSGKTLVETPALWRMSREFPEVIFDIRQASVTAEIGVMAVHFEGEPVAVQGALEFLRRQGVLVEPIEKNLLES